MSKQHTTYRGNKINMDVMRRENEKVPAIGNMKVNAKGDQISGGNITKTADDIARERHRVQSVLVNSGLKGPQPTSNVNLDVAKPAAKTTTKTAKEKELPNGDIVIDNDK